jgi:hypothetical protein
MNILAHQGGWDEIVLVLGPVAAFAALLWVATRRLSRRIDDAESSRAADAPGADHHSER